MSRATAALLVLLMLGSAAVALEHGDADGSRITPTATSVGNFFSVLTLPATTTAYTAGQLMANTATANAVAVPVITLASSGAVLIPRARLVTNDSTSTAWPGVTVQIDLWSSPPTFSGGDRTTFALSTGSAAHLGTLLCTMSSEYGDGAYGDCSPTVGNVISAKLPLQSTSVYWTAQASTASGITGASKTMTLTLETIQ